LDATHGQGGCPRCCAASATASAGSTHAAVGGHLRHAPHRARRSSRTQTRTIPWPATATFSASRPGATWGPAGSAGSPSARSGSRTPPSSCFRRPATRASPTTSAARPVLRRARLRLPRSRRQPRPHQRAALSRRRSRAPTRPVPFVNPPCHVPRGASLTTADVADRDRGRPRSTEGDTRPWPRGLARSRPRHTLPTATT
jgi:hypothetical protein